MDAQTLSDGFKRKVKVTLSGEKKTSVYEGDTAKKERNDWRGLKTMLVVQGMQALPFYINSSKAADDTK